MFNINNISDKYSSLYLNDDIKDKFFSLLLIGLDNKYMDVDAETLNNTTQHYKDKLNIRFKEVFNKNFNLKSKDHVGFLSDTLGVNFTFKNLNTNKNRNTFKVYNKTLYFLNDGNEYGLVLKNNKKSLQGGLAESSLKAFEKLNLEGGQVNNINNTSTESSKTSNAQSNVSNVSDSSYENESKLQPQHLKNLLKTYLDEDTNDDVKECVYNCYINELTEEFKIQLNDKLNQITEEKMNLFEEKMNLFESDRVRVSPLEYLLKKFNPNNQENYEEDKKKFENIFDKDKHNYDIEQYKYNKLQKSILNFWNNNFGY